MKVKVLGAGCPKCKKLYEEATRAIVESGMSVEIEKVEQIDDILSYGVMMTPALVVDDEVKVCGRVAKASEIASWIKEKA